MIARRMLHVSVIVCNEITHQQFALCSPLCFNVNMKCADNLFVVRDPLARVLSSFYYERPNMTEDDPFGGKKWHSELLYVAGPTGASGNGTTGCGFWTLQELAQRGLMNTDNDEQSTKCRARAYNTVTGTGRYLTHT